jgi:hypothetical protein
MKRNTPLITLLTGAALGLVLLVVSMLATPSKAPAGYAGAATPTPASAATAATGASSPAAASPTAAVSSPAATASSNAQFRADYAGRVKGGIHASVAISIHGTQAIAYACNGLSVEAWLSGTAADGRLALTGKNGAALTGNYDSRRAFGNVFAEGITYAFSVYMVKKPSGLYRATADVRGATIKAGWIVLPDGTQVGSLESNADSAAPSATAAPPLDVATGTAQDGDTILHVISISGVTGSGF